MHPSLCLELSGIKGRNARYQCRWKNSSACGEYRCVATVVVAQKLLCLSPATDRASARTTILESNRVDDLSASPKAFRPSGEYLIFARYLKHTRFVLLSYYMHPY
jgi:hypothetical protein